MTSDAVTSLPSFAITGDDPQQYPRTRLDFTNSYAFTLSPAGVFVGSRHQVRVGEIYSEGDGQWSVTPPSYDEFAWLARGGGGGGTLALSTAPEPPYQGAAPGEFEYSPGTGVFYEVRGVSSDGATKIVHPGPFVPSVTPFPADLPVGSEFSYIDGAGGLRLFADKCAGSEVVSASVPRYVRVPNAPGQVNANGWAIGQGGQVAGEAGAVLTAGGYVWQAGTVVDLSVADPDPAHQDEPVALNDANQVAVQGFDTGAPGTGGYLWEGGARTYLRDKLPVYLQAQVSNLEPTMLSEQGADGSVCLLATALEAGQPITVLCQRDAQSHWSFAKVRLPESTYATDINSTGIIAVRGTISSSNVQHALLLCPADVVEDSNDNHQVDPSVSYTSKSGGNPQYVVNNGDKILSYVRFGLWDHAFSPDGTLIYGGDDTTDFIGLDSRRFYFRFRFPTRTKGAGAGGTLTAHWYTQKADGTADDHPVKDTITLAETGPGTGIFVSKSLMLVTDDVDNKVGLPGGTSVSQGVAEHRLRRASIDDTVCFKVSVPGGGPDAPLDPVPIYEPHPGQLPGANGVRDLYVRLINTRGGTTNAPIADNDAINVIKSGTAQRLAIAGIRVHFLYDPATDIINFPQQDDPHSSDITKRSIDLQNLPLVTTSGAISQSATILFRRVSQRYHELLRDELIILVMVNGFSDALNGASYTEGYFRRNPDTSPIATHCSIIAKPPHLTPLLAAHEIGHQLLDQIAADVGTYQGKEQGNHYHGPLAQYNLMYGSGYNNYGPGDVKDEKRLFDYYIGEVDIYGMREDQITYMRQSDILSPY